MTGFTGSSLRCADSPHWGLKREECCVKGRDKAWIQCWMQQGELSAAEWVGLTCTGCCMKALGGLGRCLHVGFAIRGRWDRPAKAPAALEWRYVQLIVSNRKQLPFATTWKENKCRDVELKLFPHLNKKFKQTFEPAGPHSDSDLNL